MKDFIVKTILLLMAFGFVCYTTNAGSKINYDIIQKKYTDIPASASLKVRKIALSAAVKVIQKETGSYGSGAYTRIDDDFYVLTAAHVVNNLKVLSIQNGYEVVPGTVVYKDDKHDIAILKVEQMTSRTPLRYKISDAQDYPGETVLYAGYPNDHDLLLFFGNIAGKSGDVVFIHSYAWMGSSGSVVLDLKGKIVGILSAVDVGGAFGAPQIVEDMVWISDARSIDLKKIKTIPTL
jgi:hypothetical protein